jgi:osmotically-inducible protein OsmY
MMLFESFFMIPSPLLHRIDHAIRTNPHASRRRVFLESAQGKVVLRGKVDTFYQKQMIQESLRGIEGIGAISNLLEVEEQLA